VLLEILKKEQYENSCICSRCIECIDLKLNTVLVVSRPMFTLLVVLLMMKLISFNHMVLFLLAKEWQYNGRKEFLELLGLVFKSNIFLGATSVIW